VQYIGLDLHKASFSLAVLGEDGEMLLQQTRATSGEGLIRLVSALSGDKVIALEESTLADWAFRLLSPHAAVIVSDPRRNRWIAGDEKITDEAAARKLAELLRAGLLKPVHHSQSLERQEFKELVQTYHDLSKQITRYKNKLKAKFRRRGIPCTGSAVYGEQGREAWLAKLPSEGARLQAQLLWDTLDHLLCQQDDLRRKLARLAKQFVQVERFQALPGVGLIRAATFFAFVDTPHRFATKSKLWTYCCLGIAQAKSGQSSGPEHLTYFGNRILKDALKGAALSAIHAGDNPFAEKYRRQVADKKAPELALLDTARAIASTLWALWRRGEEYEPNRPVAPQWQRAKTGSAHDTATTTATASSSETAKTTATTGAAMHTVV
jgi:transposase